MPVRTCIGCRERVEHTALIRVVARGSVVTPDPAGSLPGRGAHLHPTIDCVMLAIRRKAFGRALLVEGPLDLRAIEALVAAQQ